MKITGRDAESFAKKPKEVVWAALIFGADDGVVSDTAKLLSDSWSGGKPLEIQTLDESDIKSDPRLLFDALEAQSLLGDVRIVRIRTKGERISDHILKAIAEGEKKPDQFGGRLLILAETLAPRSKLRSNIEKSKHSVAIQCYADTVTDAQAIIKRELEKDNVQIEADALALFSSTLPGHRALMRAEIEKLALYGLDQELPITVQDIKALAAGNVDHELYALVAHTLNGETVKAFREYERLVSSGVNAISVLRAFDREMQRMLLTHELIATTGKRDHSIGMRLRPPIWQSEWPAFSKRLRAWNVRKIRAAIQKLYDIELNTKKGGTVAEPELRVLIRSLSSVSGNR